MVADSTFKPALLIVDFQEDFCPPNGSLAIPNGRAIASAVNALLSLPFALKIATRDWHPPSHISFASNHPDPAQPYTSTAKITHPDDPSLSYESTLWPVHCLQDSHGAQLVPELHVDKVHYVVDKGQDDRVEMYSAFYDTFRVSDSGLTKRLQDEAITDVYVVGLAADYCVKATAEHSHDEGFRTFIVEEGTLPAMPEQWARKRAALTAKGVKMVSIKGEEVARVK